MSIDTGFIGSLVEMAKAYEEAPKLQAQIAELSKDNAAQRDTVAARETSIIGLKAELEALHNTLRSVEVERDQAQFRVLEVEEQSNAILGNIKAALSNLEQAENIVSPPPPVAVAEQSPVTEPAATADHATPVYDSTGARVGWVDRTMTDHDTPEASPVAQPDPTHAASEVHTSSPSVSSETVATDASSQQPSEGPSVPSPTAAQASPTTTGQGQAEGDTDYLPGEPRPMYDHTQNVRQEWWNWYDHQPQSIKDDVTWNNHKS